MKPYLEIDQQILIRVLPLAKSRNFYDSNKLVYIQA